MTELMKNWMLSVDSHIIEPPDMFTTHGPKALRDKMPRVVDDNGVDRWHIPGEFTTKTQLTDPARAGDRFDPEETRRKRKTFEADVPPGGWQPKAFVEENMRDGVWGANIFPSMALVFYQVQNSEVLTGICNAYNEWVMEFCNYAPKQLRAAVMINTDDPAEGAKQLQYWHDRGAASALIPAFQPEEFNYARPEYDVLWDTASGLNMPLSMHVGTNRTTGVFALLRASANICNPDFWVRRSMADIIFSGACERFPKLQVGSVENEAAWMRAFLWRMDFTYEQNFRLVDAIKFKDGMKPSDFFRRNMFVSFAEDAVAVDDRKKIGLENLMWGNDYPHTESTYPHSRSMVADLLAGVPEDERYAITCSNVARVFGFELPATQPA